MRCNCCGWRFGKGEGSYSSCLRSAHSSIVLCNACARNEERRIREANSNNIPELAKQYDVCVFSPASVW
jgi:hypothetical protein